MARRAKRNSKKSSPGEAIVILALGLVAVVGFGLLWIASLWHGLGSILLLPLFAAGIYFTVTLFSRRHKRYRFAKATLPEIDLMSGQQFEHYLGWAFRTLGYSVKTTSATNDFGADLLLVGGGRRIVVQTKRWSSAVGIQAVQEAHAASAHYGATEAWVVTTNTFTQSAKDLAKTTQVRLIERGELIDILMKVNPDLTQAPPWAYVERTTTEKHSG